MITTEDMKGLTNSELTEIASSALEVLVQRGNTTLEHPLTSVRTFSNRIASLKARRDQIEKRLNAADLDNDEDARP